MIRRVAEWPQIGEALDVVNVEQAGGVETVAHEATVLFTQADEVIAEVTHSGAQTCDRRRGFTRAAIAHEQDATARVANKAGMNELHAAIFEPRREHLVKRSGAFVEIEARGAFG